MSAVSIPKTPEKKNARKSRASPSTPAKKPASHYSDRLDDKPEPITQELIAKSPDDADFATEVMPGAPAHLDHQTRLQSALLATHPRMVKRNMPWTIVRTLHVDVEGEEVDQALLFSNTSQAGANMHNNADHPIKMNDSLKHTFCESHMYPRMLVKDKYGVPTMIPKFPFLQKPGWHMVHGSTAIPLDENWGKLKALAEKGVFDPYEPTLNEVYVSNEEAAEILEHMKLRKFTKVMHTETDIK